MYEYLHRKSHFPWNHRSKCSCNFLQYCYMLHSDDKNDYRDIRWCLKSNINEATWQDKRKKIHLLCFLAREMLIWALLFGLSTLTLGLHSLLFLWNLIFWSIANCQHFGSTYLDHRQKDFRESLLATLNIMVLLQNWITSRPTWSLTPFETWIQWLSPYTYRFTATYSETNYYVG